MTLDFRPWTLDSYATVPLREIPDLAKRSLKVRGKMKKTEAQSKTFEASLAALEKIVRELERGDLPLEESLKLFEQGVQLSRECQERLSQAERRIEVLLSDSDGRPVLSAFNQEEDLRVSKELEADQDESVF